MKANLVVFDLDGTLTPQRSSSTAAFQKSLLSNVRAKCTALRNHGCILAIATNQGGARLGRSPRLAIGAVLAQLRWVGDQLDISAFRFATTEKRKKPNPIMLIELMDRFLAVPSDTIFVGDSNSDCLAAEAAGVRFEWANDFFCRSLGSQKP